MGFMQEIRVSFLRAEGLYRLMLVNIIVFLVIGISKVLMYLSGGGTYWLMLILEKVAVRSSVEALANQPWSLITYMFVHENFFHILFNMLILFWTGKIFCEYLGSKKIVTVYFLGGIAGALLYIAAYNVFPAFNDVVEHSHLIGASAGVIAVLVAIATLIPDYSIHLLLFGPVRLKYIALFLTLLYLISIPDGNAGGNISHLGGALFGFVYTKSLRAGHDLGGWFEFITSKITGLFTPGSRIRVVHNKRKSASAYAADKRNRQEVIDAILDKISQSGYSSLSREEKEILFRESNNQGGR
jgi:membrane associated rhomboid family serine protease